MLAEGVLLGKAFWCFLKWNAIWERWEASFEKALQKVCIFIHWVNSDPGKCQIYGKSKGAQTLHFWAQTCSCHMPLPSVIWNIFRDLPLKRRILKKYRSRSELVAELGPCTQPYSWTRGGPLQGASCKLTCSEQHYHNVQTGMVIGVTPRGAVPFGSSHAGSSCYNHEEWVVML